MEWDKTQLRTASFKGVEFPCVLSVSVHHQKRHREVGFPNRPGSLAWDGARKGVAITMSAIFGVHGLDGPSVPVSRSEDLIAKIDEIGPGTLVHPTKGDIWALCTSCDEDIRGEEPNQVRLRLSFLELAQSEHAWKRVVRVLSPEAQAEVLARNLDSSLGWTGLDLSFSFHVTAFLNVLLLPTLTVALLQSSLAATLQAILSLTDTIDVAVNPLYWDHIADAHLLGQYCIEASDLYIGAATPTKLYLVKREMTLMDVAAACGCSESDVLQYNAIGDPLEIRANTYLIVPA